MKTKACEIMTKMEDIQTEIEELTADLTKQYDDLQAQLVNERLKCSHSNKVVCRSSYNDGDYHGDGAGTIYLYSCHDCGYHWEEYVYDD